MLRAAAGDDARRPSEVHGRSATKAEQYRTGPSVGETSPCADDVLLPAALPARAHLLPSRPPRVGEE